MDKIEKYIQMLMDKSTPDNPMWNIENVRQGKKSKWNYVDGCMIKAVIEMYHITGEKKYLDFADGFVDAKVDDNGNIDGYNIDDLNIDNVNAGKTLFELYDITGKEKYRKAIDVIYSQIEKMPRTKEGNFWHKKIYPNQVWLDGLYMGQPFYMEYDGRYGNKAHYDDIKKQFENVIRIMRNPLNGLYYHAYDESREIFWCDKVTGLSQNVWLRAIGWYSMALLDTYEKADPAETEIRDMLKNAFVDLMDSMIKYQDETGMWYQVVNFGGMEKNYLETSGSSILAYAILKGVRIGVLDESYRKYGEKAFDGVTENRLNVDDNGELHMDGICLVAGLGGKTNRPGTYDYYMSEPVVKDDAKGVGPYLLAYTEIRRIRG
jgi:unsaturated rhamnogalacturonyl hydrolase